jgi:hypothetical protein
MEMIFAQLLFWIGNIADWYTTKRLVLDKGTAQELNPVIAWMIEKLEKPGKEDMIDLGFQKMHKAEIALLVFKVAIGLGLYGFFIPSIGIAPALYFWIWGGILTLVAASNKWGLLGKLIKKIKER